MKTTEHSSTPSANAGTGLSHDHQPAPHHDVRATALALLRQAASPGGTPRYPVPPGATGCAVYLELEGDDAEALRTAAATIRRAFAAAGGRADRAWVASGPAELERLKALRHAVLRHRLVLTFEAVADRVRPELLIDSLFDAVPAP